MDEDSLRNWGYYEPPLKSHLGLQLMSSVTERDTKPFLSGRDNPAVVSSNGAFHTRDYIVTEPPLSNIDYVRDSWINHRDKFLHMLPGNGYNPVLTEPSGSHHSLQMVHQAEASNETMLANEGPASKKESGSTKRGAPAAAAKTSKAKKPKKGPSPKENNSNASVQRAKTVKKSVEVSINGVDMDITGIPIPVCTCTGTPQQCYRWGCGGWQSACCTTTISMHPLPMSTKRKGARIAGRKMSQGAFKKVLEKLASEDYDFGNPIDLRTYWAKHGTNKFVVIR